MNYISIFEKVFDKYTQKNMIEFVNKINLTDADYYVVMARKGKCFWDFLVDANLINVAGKVITERCFDMDYSYLEGKKIIIVDDVVISGTSIYSIVEKLEKIPILSLKICVLGVDECFNPTLFDYSIIKNEGKTETANYLTLPYIKMDNSQCINLCSSIVKCFSFIPRAYDVDFPVFEKNIFGDNAFKRLISFYAWEVFDVTAEHQVNEGILVLTLIPTKNTGVLLKGKIGFDILKYCFVKIRLFIQTRQKNKKTYEISMVPFVLFNEVHQSSIEILFGKVKEYLRLRCENCDIDKYDTYFTSYRSKIRFIQYILALKLANIWKEEIKGFCDKDITLRLKRDNFVSIFPEVFWQDINYFNNTAVVFQDVEFQKVDMRIIDSLYAFNSFELTIKDTDYWSLQTRLTEPFIALYKDKELKSRQLVQKYGKDVYKKEEYKNAVGRLNLGYSYRYLTNILKDATDFDIDRLVSLYIDKAIDAGIIVPVTIEKNHILFRAYRHGEDVPFGDLELQVCTVLLDTFCSDNRNILMTKLRIEKVLILMLKLNDQMKLFTNFLTRNQNESVITNDIVQVSYYLHGAVATVHDREDYKNRPPKRFMEYSSQYKWLTKILTDKKILKYNKTTKRYYIDEQMREDELGRRLKSEISIIGQLLGRLCMNAHDNVKPQLTDADLVILSSCLTPNDIIPALAAEINIFKGAWLTAKKYIIRKIKTNSGLEDIIKELKSDYLCKSLNSGSWKFLSFMNNKGSQIIERVYDELDDEIMRNNWIRFWPENCAWTREGINKQYLNLIYKQGRWLLYQTVLNRLLIIGILKQIDTITPENRNQNRIHSNVEKLDKYLKILEEYNDEFTKHIVVQTKEKLNQFSEDKYLFSDTIMDVINMINYLVKVSVSILDESELILSKYSEIHKIIRFKDAIYIETFSENDSILNDTNLQKIMNKVHKNVSDCEFYLIPQNHNRFKKGEWIIASGKESTRFLIEFILEYRKVNKGKYKYYAFLEMSDAAQIKKADMSNTNYRYGMFWEKVQLLYNETNKATPNIDEITVVFNNAKKLTTKHSNILNMLSEKDFICYDQKKVSFDDELIKHDVCFISYYKETSAKKGKKMGKIDIAIITIVASETRAILNVLKEYKTERTHERKYYYGTIDCGEKSYNVAVISLLSPGNISSALMYSEIMKYIAPKYILLFGIAGGISPKLKVNDVVIATEVLYYEKAKEIQNNKFKRRGEDQLLDPRIVETIKEFEIKYGETPAFDYINENGEHLKFRTFSGPIGSGEIVFASDESDTKEWMLNYNDKVLAVETEGYGIVQAYYEERMQKKAAPIFIIRGISDTADSNKDDDYRESSAQNAATVMIKFLEILEV